MEKRIIKITSIFLIILMLLSLNLFAKEKYFDISIPKDFALIQDTQGSIKLNATKINGELNFNVQVVETEDVYYEYTEEGLKEVLENTAVDIIDYNVEDLDGEIGKISEYPCYIIRYSVQPKETDLRMYAKQILLYEDTYTYMITVGAKNKSDLDSEEINSALNSIKLVKYDRRNVLKNRPKIEEPKTDSTQNNEISSQITKFIDNIKNLQKPILIAISVVSTLLLLFIIIIVISATKKHNKAKKENLRKRI